MKGIDFSLVFFWILVGTTFFSILGITGVLIYGMMPQFLGWLLTAK